MTDLLYQAESYQKNFTATVTGVDRENSAVLLNQTCFYPGGGGQPCDLGTLQQVDRNYSVLKVRRGEGGILHYIEPQDPFPDISSQVNGLLDWERRYKLMRTHTALHILCGVVFRDYGALVTGGDMDLQQGRMDFEFETLHKDLVQEIETAVNTEVIKALPIRTKILPRQEAFSIPDLIRTKINLLPEGIQFVRVVEIVGLDLQADGGTHVKNTQEVGHIRIMDYKSKGRINKRIYISLEDS